jgi:uncharacterized protein (DUF1330 family)
MAAYLIANVQVNDPAAYEEYRKQVPATIAAHGGRYLCRGGTVEVLEGAFDPKRVVVLEFPSMAALKTWYGCPEYQELLGIRERTATTTLIAIDGV